MNYFACCFCVIIWNLNTHSYKHVQIKEPVKITTLNSNFRVLLVKILLYLTFWQPFWIFGQSSWIFIGLLGIKTSNLNTSFVVICQIHAINKNYSLKFEFQGVNWWILLNFKLFGGLLNFLAAILVFIGSSGIKFSNLGTSFLTIFHNYAFNKNYSLKF